MVTLRLPSFFELTLALRRRVWQFGLCWPACAEAAAACPQPVLKQKRHTCATVLATLASTTPVRHLICRCSKWIREGERGPSSHA